MFRLFSLNLYVLVFLQETEKARALRKIRGAAYFFSMLCFNDFFLSQFVCLFVLQETEKARAVREMEERLISSAFYNLSMQMHRSTVEARLSNIHSTSSTHGQSFLARQR